MTAFRTEFFQALTEPFVLSTLVMPTCAGLLADAPQVESPTPVQRSWLVKMPKLVKTASVPVLLSAVAAVVVGTQPAGAVSAQVPVSAVESTVQAVQSRQLLGQVTGGGPTYLEASAHTAGTYAVEYDIKGTAFYDTYVDDIGLGYVGGGTGIYRTRSVTLSAGGHLVKVPGVEGSATASVYLVQIS